MCGSLGNKVVHHKEGDKGNFRKEQLAFYEHKFSFITSQQEEKLVDYDTLCRLITKFYFSELSNF
jgi:hypothetical protein